MHFVGTCASVLEVGDRIGVFVYSALVSNQGGQAKIHAKHYCSWKSSSAPPPSLAFNCTRLSPQTFTQAHLCSLKGLKPKFRNKASQPAENLGVLEPVPHFCVCMVRAKNASSQCRHSPLQVTAVFLFSQAVDLRQLGRVDGICKVQRLGITKELFLEGETHTRSHLTFAEVLRKKSVKGWAQIRKEGRSMRPTSCMLNSFHSKCPSLQSRKKWTKNNACLRKVK